MRVSSSKWGTIVSNLSFANHAEYVAHYDKKQVGKYIDRYKEILASLASGGSFVYAPSVAYLEDTIDSLNFTAESWSVSKIARATRVKKNAL